MMTNEQETHLQLIKDTFCEAVDKKYRAGQVEHGGDIWTKPVLDELWNEIVDLAVYYITLKQKITKLDAELSRKLENTL